MPSSARSWSAVQLRCWWHSDGSCPPAFRARQDITTGSGPNTGEQRKPYCLMLVQLNMGNMKHCDAMPNGKEVVLICLISSPDWLFLWRENKANCILIYLSSLKPLLKNHSSGGNCHAENPFSFFCLFYTPVCIPPIVALGIANSSLCLCKLSPTWLLVLSSEFTIYHRAVNSIPPYWSNKERLYLSINM